MTDLVFIHGWGFGSGVWDSAATRLARWSRPILLDLPGYGPSVPPEHLPPRAVICGWSLGAQMAMRLAAEFPERVSGLILVSATPRFLSTDDWPYGQPPDMLRDFSASVAHDSLLALKRFAALVNHGDTAAPHATRLLQGLAKGGHPDRHVLAAGLASLQATDLRALAGTIRQPTLIVHGQNDALMPPAAGQWIARAIDGAEFAVLPGRGHAPFLSAPKEFADLVVRFIEGQVRPQPNTR